MTQGRTAHVDTFARDRLPPRDQQPQYIFELPELQFPPQLNCATELLDKAIAPVFMTANQHAASIGLFGARSSTRWPGRTPISSTSTCAIASALRCRSA